MPVDAGMARSGRRTFRVVKAGLASLEMGASPTSVLLRQHVESSRNQPDGVESHDTTKGGMGRCLSFHVVSPMGREAARLSFREPALH